MGSNNELYQQILGLASPWKVVDVRLEVESQAVHIFLEHDSESSFRCPKCDREYGCYDHAPGRTWRHLNTCQFQTLVHASVPRVHCEEHGVVQVQVPWAEPHGRFTMLMERFVIDVLLACQTVTGACQLLNISWDQAWHVMDRAVKRGMLRKEAIPSRLLGVDEKAFRKGHRYLTIVNDIERGTVEFISENREKASLGEFYKSRTPEQLRAIDAIAMDMWEPYVQATLEWLPLGKDKIVFDRFHIMKRANEGLDKVRKEEHRALMALGSKTLGKTKYLWLYGEENIPEHRQEEFDALKASSLKTARAWSIKETLRGLWSYKSVHWARRFFASWKKWVDRCQLEPLKRVCAMIHERLDNVLTYCKHPITNGVAEGLNSKIMSIKRRAGGFRNVENFKTAIYFHCGGLSLYP
jgi:transposase